MKKLLPVAFFTAIWCSVSAQNRPFAIWEDQSISAYRFVQLDASTGTKSNISILPGISGFVAGDNATFNTHLNRYHFIALMAGQYYLYTIDATTGNVIYNPLITEIFAGIQYNCADSTLYALRVNGSVHNFVKIDPATGTSTLIWGIPNTTGYVSGSFSLDYRNGWFNFVALSSSTFKLKCVDVQTGLVVHDNVFTDNLTGFEYSCKDSAVYGLWDNGGVYKLEKVDLVNGTHTTIGVLSNVTPGFVSESSSVNSNGEYTYRGFDGGNNFALITIDLATANVIHNSNTSDNAVGFAEPTCCADTTTSGGSGIAEEDASALLLFPVPADERLVIQSGSFLQQVEIYTVEGRKTGTIPVNAHRFEMSTAQLPAGIYILRSSGPQGTGIARFSVLH